VQSLLRGMTRQEQKPDNHEDIMHIEAKPTQHSDSVKKPYQAPDLVVMGAAVTMTQAAPNFGAGDIFTTGSDLS